MYAFIICVFFSSMNLEKGKLFFWDPVFLKLGEGKKRGGFAMLPTLECSGYSQAKSHYSDLLLPTWAASPHLRQPGDPQLPGGHYINAKQYRHLISTAHYSPELLGSTDLPASASQVALTTCHLHVSCMFGVFRAWFCFFCHPDPFVVEIKK